MLDSWYNILVMLKDIYYGSLAALHFVSSDNAFYLRAIDKFFSLGVLTFTTFISSCVLHVAMCYTPHIEMPPSTHLSTPLYLYLYSTEF